MLLSSEQKAQIRKPEAFW